ncbi:tRNA-intron endonuclease [Cladophialophora bantiana CBS 173.52]|uniref:tRNA-intron lyase n=1 Tax=Cladophialophora bantiana (strain ATCC 10958 / CBS 173.52 / CDC B-1940 / NIH 8579) TaxID=1442370 RepID=A0A0D2FB44_CLAB1|nr:tRNA-intron endonuclease [Cladophialophora bantiana CBS 173.52]KIW99331.1 tRNA-intron endonuclease [Cladophialophora bantiana CBS 173.52]
MASDSAPPVSPEASSTRLPSSKPPKRPKRPNYNHIHRHLLPIEVHPLPVLIPHNPLSLVAIALSYLVQVLSPPTRPTYNGYFSSATSSVHVTDPDTIRKLWEMGFFGRGSLSRSEPNWLENRKKKGRTAEENTASRREQRRQLKQERARKEQEEIDQKLSEESQQNGNIIVELDDSVEQEPAPESQPDGDVDLNLSQTSDKLKLNQLPQNGSLNSHINGVLTENVLKTNAQNISDIGSVLESASGTPTPEAEEDKENDSIHGFEEWKKAIEANGIPTPPPTSTCSDTSQAEGRPVKRLQRTKIVRFSPTIEAREFDLSSPVISPIKSPGTSPLEDAIPESERPVQQENQEHLNVSLEEAFFLSYALGVLDIYCDDSNTVLPPTSLLSLFRRHSYHPPRSLSVPAEPDDPFMISYTVYHHYRSLGWVVRSGVKFSTDYLLYNRGPAFSHAEFAVAIIPSYTDPYWTESTSPEQRKAIEKKTSRKSWWWLHGINRVQAQVHKQLVLCYVDVPPPLKDVEKRKDVDIGFLFSRYKIRDVNVRRWTPNRSRE